MHLEEIENTVLVRAMKYSQFPYFTPDNISVGPLEIRSSERTTELPRSDSNDWSYVLCGKPYLSIFYRECGNFTAIKIDFASLPSR